MNHRNNLNKNMLGRLSKVISALTLITLDLVYSHSAGAADLSRVPAAVFEPTFVTTEGDLRAGKVFAATLPACKDALLVSALHLFGPSGGMKKQSSGSQIAALVTNISLDDIAGKVSIEKFRARSLTPDKASCCTDKADTGAGDIAAFAAPEELRGLALRVATRPVKKGDKVFVISSIASPAVTRLSHAAIAEGMESGYWLYTYLEPGFVVRATSGAPVVNEAGEVVAINLGGATSKTGKMMGYGNPAVNWSAALASMCQRSAGD